MSYIITFSGKNLPIKDIKSSDPYFIFKVAEEVKYTSEVIDSNLNPEWKEIRIEKVGVDDSVLRINEDAHFYYPGGMVLVTFEVWDKDRLSKDDFMGNTYVGTGKSDF